MEEPSSSGTSVLTRATRRNVQEHGILHDRCLLRKLLETYDCGQGDVCMYSHSMVHGHCLRDTQETLLLKAYLWLPRGVLLPLLNSPRSRFAVSERRTS
jgi:hypothetical protein